MSDLDALIVTYAEVPDGEMWFVDVENARLALREAVRESLRAGGLVSPREVQETYAKRLRATAGVVLVNVGTGGDS